ncbi:hypothetical protein B0H17DRAFT_1222135 [Mycena rosella]|uniref:Uncharacterized protein n=1 Tax=Mycena rosella TaxID=1033263 RepID=A0AAD7AYU0_MYCRO|nr:hypothetical protein B0H17DRAFT_1222135 [Mycena rosella]
MARVRLAKGERARSMSLAVAARQFHVLVQTHPPLAVINTYERSHASHTPRMLHAHNAPQISGFFYAPSTILPCLCSPAAEIYHRITRLWKKGRAFARSLQVYIPAIASAPLGVRCSALTPRVSAPAESIFCQLSCALASLAHANWARPTRLYGGSHKTTDPPIALIS